MRVQKNKQNIFVLIIDLAIFMGVIIGLITALVLTDVKASKDNISNINSLKAISTFVVGDYSDEPDKDTANIKLKQDLKTKYDMDVFSEAEAYTMAKSVNAESLYDKHQVYDMLYEISSCLSKYPENIFQEIESKEYKIHICLVDKFNNNNVALATRDSNNNFAVYISNTNIIEKAVHHELYHILEYYMKLEYDLNELYKDWMNYNPKGFKYNENLQELDSEHVYNHSTNKTGASFVTVYAKTMDKEDRAETFADMMIKNSRPSYYNDGENIGNKIRYISSVIDKTFETVRKSQYPVYWKRFI